MKDLFHGYYKATLANSELNPYDPIDGNASIVPALDKSEKELMDRPVDLHTPDAVVESDSPIGVRI